MMNNSSVIPIHTWDTGSPIKSAQRSGVDSFERDIHIVEDINNQENEVNCTRSGKRNQTDSIQNSLYEHNVEEDEYSEDNDEDSQGDTEEEYSEEYSEESENEHDISSTQYIKKMEYYHEHPNEDRQLYGNGDNNNDDGDTYEHMFSNINNGDNISECIVGDEPNATDCILGLIEEYDTVMGEGNHQVQASQYQTNMFEYDEEESEEDDDGEGEIQYGDHYHDHPQMPQRNPNPNPNNSKKSSKHFKQFHTNGYNANGINKANVKSSGYGPPKKPKRHVNHAKIRLEKMKLLRQQQEIAEYDEEMRDDMYVSSGRRDDGVGATDMDGDNHPVSREKKHHRSASTSDANAKYRQWMEAMAEKKRAEEEELSRQVEVARLKRKKFKEALLEKARKAREDNAVSDQLRDENGELIPTFLAPTKAFQVQQAPKRNTEEDVPAEEMLRLEREKIEQVSKVRRKFKEQHKMLLEKLTKKNNEIKLLEAEAMQRKKKKKVYRPQPPPAVETSLNQKDVTDAETYDAEILRVLKSNKKSRYAKTNSSDEDVDVQDGTAAGSGLAAIRASSNHSHSRQKDAEGDVEEGEGVQSKRNIKRTIRRSAEVSGAPGDECAAAASPQRVKKEKSKSHTQPHPPTANDHAEHEKGDGSDRDSAVSAPVPARVRKIKGVSKQNLTNANPHDSDAVEEHAPMSNATGTGSVGPPLKMTDYLKSIAESRKQEEEDRIKKEERMKKRMLLLSNRLLKEAAERKLMAAEDAWKPTPTTQDAEVSKKKISNKYKDVASKVFAAAKPKNVEGESNSNAQSKPMKSRRARAVEAKKDTDVSDEESSASSDSSAEKSPKAPKSKLSSKKIVKPPVVSRRSGSLQDTVHGSNYQPRDFMDWKRKNDVPPDGKVFIMTGWYPCVKEALIERGWYFNPDPSSPFADLKWTLKSVDVNQDTLLPWQLTNHFLKNMAITTKAGLIKSLSSLEWAADVTANDIIPRGYDLSTPSQLKAFVDDFRCQGAVIVLRKVYKRITGLDNPLDVLRKDDAGGASSRPGTVTQPDLEATEATETGMSTPPRPTTRPGTAFTYSPAWSPVPLPAECLVKPTELMVNKAVFGACCNILEKLLKLHDFDDYYLDDVCSNLYGKDNMFANNQCNNNGYREAVITPLEWELIEGFDIFDCTKPLSDTPPETIDRFLQNENEKEFVKEYINNAKTAQKYAQYMDKEKKRLAKLENAARSITMENVLTMVPVTEVGFERIHNLLSKCKHYYHKEQINLGGREVETSKNMWIVKPAAKSRGRGITTFSDLGKLLKYVEAGNGLSTQWVVQKYMENSLLISDRKFDLRQWVLVTDWNPLTIYFFDECYARFSVEAYSTSAGDMENAFVHLVNNSIGKNSDKFGLKIPTEDGGVIDGYMLNHKNLSNYLKYKSKTGEDIMKDRIQTRMKDIARWSLMCASEMVEHRKNSWELYGFDFMVDEDYNTWLIEINSSPACDYSSKTTEAYVQKALVELLSVVLDTREWEALPKKEREKTTKPDTGGWSCIYKGPLLDKPVSAFGTDMSVKGDAIRLPAPPKRVIEKGNIMYDRLETKNNEKESSHGLTGSPKKKNGKTKNQLVGKKQVDRDIVVNVSDTASKDEEVRKEERDEVQADPNSKLDATLSGFDDSDDDVSMDSVKRNPLIATTPEVATFTPAIPTSPVDTTRPARSNQSNSRNSARKGSSTTLPVPVSKGGQAVVPISIKTFCMDL